MKWLRCWVWLICPLLAACAADGGPVGTGISTSAITGNVVTVAGSSGSTVPPVQVSIDGVPSVTTTTDSGGNFALSGNFAGAITLRFTTPQFQATDPLDVPAGSTIVLQDIDLQPGSVDAQAERQFGFFGTVDTVDCPNELLVRDRRHNGMPFPVQLGTNTSIAGARGQSLTCAAIQAGDAVIITGTIQPDQTITALTVMVAPLLPPQPQPTHQITVSGAIAALDCGTGVLVVDDSMQRTRLQLTAQTVIMLAGGAALGCGDLQLGDQVSAEGRLTLRMPGLVAATRLTVAGATAPAQPLRIFGVVTAVDCGSGTVQLSDLMNPITVQLTANTTILGTNRQPLACSDLQAGDRVRGSGDVSTTAPGVIDARQLVLVNAGGPPS